MRILVAGSHCVGKVGVVCRGVESQRWARGQLKNYASLVLCSPKQPWKMAQFSPDFHVISKKKVFDVSQTDLAVSVRWALSWAPSSPWAPGSLSPLRPRSVCSKRSWLYAPTWLNFDPRLTNLFYTTLNSID